MGDATFGMDLTETNFSYYRVKNPVNAENRFHRHRSPPKIVWYPHTAERVNDPLHHVTVLNRDWSRVASRDQLAALSLLHSVSTKHYNKNEQD